MLALFFGLSIVAATGFSSGILKGAAAAAVLIPPPSVAVIVPPGDPIEIAVANSLPVPEAADMPLAVQMAVSDYGPISGFSVQLNAFDDGCNAGTGATVAAEIVANPQHVAVIGPFCSVSSVGALPVFEAAGLVMVSASNSAIGLEAFGPNVFNRTVIADPGFEPWNAVVGTLPSVSVWESEFALLQGHQPYEIAKYAYDAALLMLARIDEVSTVDGGGNLVIDRADLATAVRTTTSFPGVTSAVSLDVYGTRIDQFVTAVWMDPYAGSVLDPAWTWIDEDPSHWSLTDNPGYLRIITQTPVQNRLVLPMPEGDFEFRTRVLFTPTENFQFAGISLYLDDENFMNFGRAFCSVPPPTCEGNAIYFDFVEGGVFEPPNYPHPTAELDEAYLRIVKSGNDYTGYVSTNGTFWELVGTHTAGFVPVSIGLYATGQTATTEIPADYDFFILQTEVLKIFLPLVSR
jgi:hypothetical protein